MMPGTSVRTLALPLAAVFLAARSPGLWAYLRSTPEALGPQTAAALAGHCLDALLSAVFLAGACALGVAALRALGAAPKTAWKRLLLGLVVGEGLLSLALWALVAAGACGTAGCAGLLILLAAAAWRGRAELAVLRPASPRGRLETVCASVALAALLRGAAAAGAPVTDWDTLAYHFAFPKLYLLAGSFHRLPWSTTAHYPLNAEMLYAWALALRGAQLAQWLSWWHGPLLLAAAGAWAFELAGRRAAWPAAALLAATPAFSRVLGSGKNDLQAGLAILAALWAALEAARDRDGRGWLGAGLAVGAAAAAKLTGLWAAGALGLLALDETRRRRSARPALLLLAGAAALGSWWYVRNLVWTGNPVWPLLGGWLGDARGAAVYARLRAADTGGVARTPLNFLLSPFWLVLSPDRFLHPPRELLVTVALAAAAVRRRAALPRPVFAFALFYFAAWFFVSQDGRFLLPLDAVLAVAAAGLLEAVPPAGWRGGLALAALAVGLAPALSLSPNNELFGFLALSPKHDAADARDRYLLHSLGAPYALAQAANALPEGAKLLLYRDVRGFHLDRPYACAEPLDAGVVEFDKLDDSEQLAAQLKAQGFTHLLFNPTLGGYHGDQEYYARADRLMDELIRRHGERLASFGPLALYALR